MWKVFDNNLRFWQVFNDNSDETRDNVSSSTSNPTPSDVSFCDIRSPPGDIFETISIYLSIYIPTIFGPILTFVIGTSVATNTSSIREAIQKKEFQ